jgi:hypothetical protein
MGTKPSACLLRLPVQSIRKRRGASFPTDCWRPSGTAVNALGLSEAKPPCVNNRRAGGKARVIGTSDEIRTIDPGASRQNLRFMAEAWMPEAKLTPGCELNLSASGGDNTAAPCAEFDVPGCFSAASDRMCLPYGYVPGGCIRSWPYTVEAEGCRSGRATGSAETDFTKFYW